MLDQLRPVWVDSGCTLLTGKFGWEAEQPLWSAINPKATDGLTHNESDSAGRFSHLVT